MTACTITIVGIASRKYASEGKQFASLNIECLGPGGRGKAFADCVAFGDVSDELRAIDVGEPVKLLAELDSHRGKDGTWRNRFVVQKVFAPDEPIADAPQLALATP